MDNETTIRKDLAAVYKLVHHFGWDDLIFTHISAKIPGTETFLINQFGLMFNEVTASNLVKVDISGNVIGSGSINPAGFLIHSAIHEARPEVGCVIHTHTLSGVAVSIDNDGLQPISQQSLVALNSLAYHNYQGLVIDSREKKSIQDNLSNKNFMILRNHGLLTVGTSVSDAFLNMRVLQQACDIQVMCNKDTATKISAEVIENNKLKIGHASAIRSIAWSALIRIVERFYSDYAN